MKYQEEGIARIKSVNVIWGNNNLPVILRENREKIKYNESNLFAED